MKIKHILTAALLAFVAVSLAAVVADLSGLGGKATETAPPVAPRSSEQWIAYYFHTATRCPTCRAIESKARDAVAPQVNAGAVEWRVVNYEETAHRHFAAEFKLLCPSVVLVQTRDNEVVRWKNLERVWELNDDRTAFLEYMRAELAAFTEVRP
jgi:hypothetical protein